MMTMWGKVVVVGVDPSGECPHMCPDKELSEREIEDDFQLLKMVDPGVLVHPRGQMQEIAVSLAMRAHLRRI